MLFHLPLVFAVIVWGLGLWCLTLFPEYLGWLIALLGLLTLRTAWSLMRVWYGIFVPCIFTVGAVSLLYLIDSPRQQGLFILLSGGFYYLLLLGLYRLRHDRTNPLGQTLLGLSATVALFYFFSAALGLYLNFNVSPWNLVGVFGLSVGTTSYQYFRILQPNARTALLYSLVIGLSGAEIAWIIQFWPFSYLTSGIVALMCVAILWDIASRHLTHRLSHKQVLLSLVVFSLLLALVLASARWTPTV